VTGRWVSLAPARGARPDTAATAREPVASARDDCPFCEGHEDRTPPEVAAVRDGGQPDGPGWRVRVVPNLYPAFAPDDGPTDLSDALHEYGPALGACEVIIHGPEHDRWLPYMAAEQAELVMVTTWERYRHHAVGGAGAVVPLYNHGRSAGASLAHPHGQLYATRLAAPKLNEELAGAEEAHRKVGGCVFCQMAGAEEVAGERLVLADEHFVAFAPWASRSPFECWIIPRAHLADFGASSEALAAALGVSLRGVLWKIVQELGEVPLNWYVHSLPNPPAESQASYHWHLEIRPKLTDIAGFEMATGTYINTLAPESAAQMLRGHGAPPPESTPPPD
jgi:UDPglucose--hexose-1-phosphate uridylyltransferase